MKIELTKTIIRHTIITALRDWLLLGLFALSVLAVALSIFLGQTALVEEQHMSLTYMSGINRVILVVGFILFTCFHIRRALDNKEIDMILSKPISRGYFIMSYWIAFMILILVVNIPVLLVITGLGYVFYTETSIYGTVIWSMSLVCELAIMTAFAMVSTLIQRSVVSSVMSCFAFYLLSRMISFFTSLEHPLVDRGGNMIEQAMGMLIQAVAALLPRLDLYARSEWVIYNIDSNINYIWLYQSLIYIPILLAMAVIDFSRKQF